MNLVIPTFNAQQVFCRNTKIGLLTILRIASAFSCLCKRIVVTRKSVYYPQAVHVSAQSVSHAFCLLEASQTLWIFPLEMAAPHGKNIVHMTQSSNELHFFYDAQNKPAVVVYNGTPYSYVKNLQGDIVAILNSAGTAVVRYVYDAWGRPISKTGSMAGTLGTVQPFRYRGYVYDEETELFYLRNRYYSIATQRFINSDSMLGYNSIILQHNLFAYCVNSPIILTDTSGRNFFDDFWYFLWHKDDMRFWTIVGLALYAIGCPHSADLLVHSVQAKPKDLHFDGDDSITQTIMADAEFKAAITTQIDAGNFEKDFSIVFEDNFDLFGALHEVTGQIKPVVVDGRTMYHVSIFDEYNFMYEEDYSSPTSSVIKKAMVAGAITGNNLAYTSFRRGAIREYDIYIDFLYSEE